MNDHLSVQDYRTMIGGSTSAPKSSPAAGRAAVGRLPANTMNKLEQRYAAHLDARKLAGEVLWWGFEGVTFNLAPRTRYTPDFLVLLSDGRLQVHETKGHWEDDARVKIKVAADHFPIPFIAIKAGPDGGWIEETF